MSYSYVIGRNSVPLIFEGKLMGEGTFPIPPFSLRFQFSDPDYDPTKVTSWVDPSGITRTWLDGSYWVKVQGTTENRWDWYYEDPNWDYAFEGAFRDSDNRVQVILGNTSDVHSMMNLFDECMSLDSICWLDTAKVTTMRYMFGNTSITTVPLFDTSRVSIMSSMFAACDSLVTVPLFDTHKVEGMASMFIGCSSLQSVPLFDMGNVRYNQYMFSGCTSLTSLPTFDTHNVEVMQSFCSGCSSLTNVPLLNTQSVTNMNYAFSGCINVEHGALALYQQASSQEYPPSNHDDVFKNCGSNTASGRAELLGIPQDWGGGTYVG